MTENKRFKETISTGIVTDTVTGKQYRCEMRIDDEFLNLVNKLADENKQLKSFKEQNIKQYTTLKKVCNNHKRENEQLKQNIGIILRYCREKGKYAMNTEEVKAHNVLQRIIEKELSE